MPLSDYNNPVEKIAALKAATLDPALVQIKTIVTDSPYTTTEDIFIFNFANTLNIKEGAITYNYLDINSADEIINEKLESGVILILGDSVMFINDVDIVYSDPITTYQNRLSTILNTAGTILSNDVLTPGENGSILLSAYHPQLADGSYLSYNAIHNPLPIPTGTILTETGIAKYFDVPDDW